MNDVNQFALQQAERAAATLWSLGSAPFPHTLATAAIIQGHIDRLVTDTAIVFAIHVRRILDNNAIHTQFILNEPFRLWTASRLPRVTELREALNRIVHATEFEVGFERLPEGAANIKGGAIGVVYLRNSSGG